MSDLKSKIMNFGKSAAKTSGNLISQAKINLSLSNEESKVNAVYMDMGKKVAEIYSYGANIGDYFDEKYAELLAIKARIAALRQELDTIKGVRKCQKCGKSAPATAEFCPKCGEATGIVGHIEHSEYAENPETPDYADPPPQQNPAHFDMRFDDPIDMNTIDQPPPEPEPEPEPPLPPPSIDIKICGVCGSRNNWRDKFCLSCGRAM